MLPSRREKRCLRNECSLSLTVHSILDISGHSSWTMLDNQCLSSLPYIRKLHRNSILSSIHKRYNPDHSVRYNFHISYHTSQSSACSFQRLPSLLNIHMNLLYHDRNVRDNSGIQFHLVQYTIQAHRLAYMTLGISNNVNYRPSWDHIDTFHLYGCVRHLVHR